MNVLGISAFYHDSAACLTSGNQIVAAAAEERFSRRKGDESFPKQAITFVLNKENLSLSDLDAICFYDKPLLTFDRLLQTYFSFAPHGFNSFRHAMPVWLKQKLFTKEIIAKELKKIGLGKIKKNKILFCPHHYSHAASAFYPSHFEEAAILVMDGVGEWATTSLGYGQGTTLQLFKEIRFPHSLGLLYSAFTYYLGFKVNEGEYKIMGLAPYGTPKYVSLIKDNLIHIKPDGSYHINIDFFDYCTGIRMTNEKFHRLFGEPPRGKDSSLLPFHMDIARSIQTITEEIILKLANTAHTLTGNKNLCLAGGVALNCVANGKILREGPFKNIWIQPAASDSGGALGAALITAHLNGVQRNLSTPHDNMNNCHLGPEFSNEEIINFLKQHSINFQFLETENYVNSSPLN